MTICEMEAACDRSDVPELPEHPLQLPELSLSKTFYPLGFPMVVRTNSAAILGVNEQLWKHFSHRHNTQPMHSDIYVAAGGNATCPPAPTYQYDQPLFISIADPQHYSIVDMVAGKTFASITEASLKHRLYLEHFFLSLPLATLPAKPVHAACVAWNGCGVLLCGDSGAGKSTLAYACARSGWEYISDDGSFLLDCERPCVTGNCNLVRFRPSATELFPEIKGLEETPRAAGKPSIEVPTLTLPRIARRHQVRVKFIIFLNRSARAQPELVRYRKDVARLYMRQGLYGSAEIRARHFAAIERLLSLDVFELRYGELAPAISRLERLIEDGL